MVSVLRRLAGKAACIHHATQLQLWNASIHEDGLAHHLSESVKRAVTAHVCYTTRKAAANTASHVQVCHALHPKYGGRPDAELGEVAAKLSRAKVLYTCQHILFLPCWYDTLMT